MSFVIGQYSNIALDLTQREDSADLNIEQAIQLSNKALEKVWGERPLGKTGILTARRFILTYIMYISDPEQ